MMMSQPLRQTDLFGMVFEDHSSSALRRAKTSAAQTPKAKASKASVAASTSKPSASSESAVLVGSLLKTALISELGALTPSSLRWKHSATPAGRSWFVLETSAPTTSGPEAGSSDATLHKLPTPMASDGMKDGAGGGAGSTYPFRKILGTPTIKSTPRSSAFSEGRVPSPIEVLHETLPTPTKRDKRMDAWSPAYDKRKSPTMDAVLDGAMRDRASDKWQYARQIAAALQNGGLTGPSMTLPLTYNWMMGFPPGWLARALRSAVQKGHLPQVSSSKRSAMPSSRKSPKP